MLPRSQVVLVRHAQTAWSISGQHTGRTDLPLTEEGRTLTRHLKHRLAGRRFGRVLTSPLQRAAETARIAGFGDVAERVGDLLEWDYGEYDGRSTADIRSERREWDLWQDGAPSGETPQDVSDRMDRVVEVLLSSGEAGDVLVFGHGHALRALTVRWLGLPITHGRLLELDTGSISTLGWKRGVRVLRHWNDQSHMPHAP